MILILATSAVLPAPTFAEQDQTSETWRALHEKALAFEHGEGLPKDLKKAIALYCQGAMAGDPEARYSLGWIYMNGRGVPRNDGMAAYLFTLAADQGHEPSQKMLPFVSSPVTEPPDCPREYSLPGKEGEWIFTNEKQRQLAALISRLAPEYGVSPQFAFAVAHTESNLNPTAVHQKMHRGSCSSYPKLPLASM